MPIINIISEPEFEQMFTKNKHHFDRLLEIVKESNEILEGNCVYEDKTMKVLPELRINQRNLASLAQSCKRVFEIGFNAGHSSLFMLIANPDLYIQVVDICQHSYTKPCFEYLRAEFPERINLIESDSKGCWNHVDYQPFDLYHIDGSHEWRTANIDFFKCKEHAKADSLIIWGDVWSSSLDMLWKGYIHDGHVREINLLPETSYINAYAVLTKKHYNIIVCTMAIGEEYKRVVKYGQKTKELYCQKHGYAYTDEEIYDDNRPPAWSKVKLIQKCLKNKNYDYIVWIDADILIMNDRVKLTNLIQNLTQNKDITLARDWKKPNTGVMLIKNTEWNNKFFELLYEQTDFINHPNWEQGAFIHMYESNIEDAKTHINILPLNQQREFNAYWFNYEIGDFLIHFPACYKDGKNRGLDIQMHRYCPIKMDIDDEASYQKRLKWLSGPCIEETRKHLREVKKAELEREKAREKITS